MIKESVKKTYTNPIYVYALNSRASNYKQKEIELQGKTGKSTVIVKISIILSH